MEEVKNKKKITPKKTTAKKTIQKKRKVKEEKEILIDDIIDKDEEVLNKNDNLVLEDFDKEIEKDLKEESKEEDVDFFDISDKKEKKNKKRILFIIVISFILVCIIGLYIVLPKIKLKGSSTIKIPYNKEYVEKGATAKWLNQDISNRIKISGKVNTKKIGKYTITYSVKKSFLKVSKKRTVKVVDEKKPKITLEGDKDLTICPDSKYKELGYKAIDEYDGDLTKKVETKEEDNKVTYTVKDKSGNVAKVIRNIKREDKTKPELKLNGNDHIYVTLGNGYKDAGATATDNCSGDLTEKIETSGSVNTNSLGDYTITYKVTDDHGNTATKERTVTVQKEIVRRSASLGCGEPGVIYLTFDDGPNNGTTTQILDVLKKYNVKATFFVTNTNGGSDSQIKREFDEGHLVALHTSTHNYSKVYASDEAYWNDLNAINSRVEKITGKKSNIVRFPGGSSNTVSRHYSTGIMSRLANDLESKGYSYFDWNLDSRDAENKPCNEVRSNVINGLSKSRGNVVLMHDIKGPTACAIEDIVKYGLDNGYTFKVLDSSVVCHHKTAN